MTTHFKTQKELLGEQIALLEERTQAQIASLKRQYEVSSDTFIVPLAIVDEYEALVGSMGKLMQESLINSKVVMPLSECYDIYRQLGGNYKQIHIYSQALRKCNLPIVITPRINGDKESSSIGSTVSVKY